MAFEAYKVAVRLTLVESVSAGLLGLSRHFMAANKNAQQLQKSIGQIQKLMLAGGAMVGVGVFGLKALQVPLDEAKRFQTELAKFSLYGLGDKVNAEAAQFAKGMNVIGSSFTENMKLLTEAQGVFRESGLGGSAALDGAKLAAPVLAKIAFATSSLDDESKARYKTQSLDMLRFIETRGGLKDAATFNRIADEGWKAMRSSGGNVDWSQYRQFMARGGVAAQGLSDEALFGEFEPIIGELKGMTAGFSLRTAYNRLNGIVRIPNQVAHELANAGVWDANKIVWNSQGGIKAFKGNPLVNQALFSSDPIKFYESVIKPMYAKMGVTTQAQIARENAMIFGSTGGAMFSLIDRQMPAIARSVASQQKTLGIDASVKQAGGTLGGKEVDLHAKWANMMETLGEKILPMAIRGVEALVRTIDTITGFANRHPILTKFVMEFAAIFSVMSVGAGGLLMFRGALKAMAVAFEYTGPLYKFGFLLGRITRFSMIAGRALAFTSNGLAFLRGIATVIIGPLGLLARGIFMLGRFLVLTPLGLLITGIGIALYELWKHWDVVGPLLKKAWEEMKNGFGSFVNWFVGVWAKLKSYLPNWLVGGNNIGGASPNVAPAASKTQTTPGDVYLDGSKVGKHVARQMSGPLGSGLYTGGVDPGVALPMPSLK